METIIGTIIQMYSCISELFVVRYVICESRDLCNSKTNPLNDKYYVWYTQQILKLGISEI